MTTQHALIGALTAALFSAAFSSGAAAQLSGADRDAFVKSSLKACSDTAHKSKPSLPMDRVTTYCQCMADAEADMTTADDVAYINEHNAATDDYKNRINKLAPACNKKAGLR